MKTRMLIALTLAWAGGACLSGVTVAAGDSRHQQSPSYDVYFGVVPAAQTVRDGQLDKLHRMDGQHAENFGRDTQHVTVAVFRKSDGQRVTNAVVSAELVESDLIHARSTTKPLNRRSLNGGETYCNFFDLRWRGGYKVDVVIQESGRGAEKVSFVQRSF